MDSVTNARKIAREIQDEINAKEEQLRNLNADIDAAKQKRKDTPVSKVLLKDIAESMRATKELDNIKIDTLVEKQDFHFSYLSDLFKQEIGLLEKLVLKFDDLTDIANAQQNIDYQKEQESDKVHQLALKQISLLEELVRQKKVLERKKPEESQGGFWDTLWGTASGIVAGGLAAIFSKKVLIEGGKKFLKSGFIKGIGKFVLAPLAAALLAFDFTKGWKNSEEIIGKGKKSIDDKFSAAIYQIGSGLTFGLISAKKLRQIDVKISTWFSKTVTKPLIKFATDLPGKISTWFSETFTKENFNSFVDDLTELPIVGDAVGYLKEAIENVYSKMIDNVINPVKEIYNKLILYVKIAKEKLIQFSDYIAQKLPVFMTGDRDFPDITTLESSKESGATMSIGIEKFIPTKLRNKFEEMRYKNSLKNTEIPVLKKETGNIDTGDTNNMFSNVVNRNTIVNDNMSTRSDDFMHVSPIFSIQGAV